jgi:hypothetical protein
MTNSIELDKDFLNTLKNIKQLKIQVRKLEKKNYSIIRQLFKKALPSVISAHKWAIATQPDNDSDDDFFSLSLDIIPSDEKPGLYRPGSHYKKNSSALPRVVAAQAANVTNRGPFKARNIKTPSFISAPKKITDMESLTYFSERYDVYAINHNKCSINISYNRLTFISTSSMEDVFSAVKSLKFPLDLARYLKDIEISEEILLKKKKLLKDIAPTILFSM